MPILDAMRKPFQSGAGGAWLRCPAVLLAIGMLVVGGCERHDGFAAIETDANGYICRHCGAKWYTDSQVFLDLKCPKCQTDSLNETVGFLCSKDHHLTIEPRVPGLPTMSVCEQCNAVLKNAMYLPREKDLVAWGAIKAGPKQAR
jgi:phage FluMu protein Com